MSIKVLKKKLFLHLIYFKGLGGEVVGDGGGLLARGDTDSALHGDDALWLVEGVLCVHSVAVEGDGGGRGGTLEALEVQRDGLRGVGGVDDLDDDLTRLLVEH